MTLKKLLKKAYNISAAAWRGLITFFTVFSSIMVMWGLWKHSPDLNQWMIGMALFDLYYLVYEVRNVQENQRTLIGLIYKIFK